MDGISLGEMNGVVVVVVAPGKARNVSEFFEKCICVRTGYGKSFI